jgi:hypothetical protein
MTEGVTMFHCVLVGVLMATGVGDGKKGDDAAKALRDAIEKADVVVVGKVTKVGLSSASSFDVGTIEVKEVLKGDARVKSVNFRFASRGDDAAAAYGKKGVEGVWVLGKEGKYLSARQVLSYQPLSEKDAVRKLLPKTNKPGEPSKDKP